MPGEMTAPNPDGVMKPLLRKHPNEASKQLGILSAPDGNQKGQLAHLKSKAATFATNLRKQCMLTRNEVWTNLTLSIHKTMEYPMSSTRLTK